MGMRTLPWGMALWGMVIALAGCATPYQKSGFSGGYSDVQLDSNTFNVEFRGNGYTRRQTVETYLLYRCAQLTAEAGYDYFVIVGRDTDTKNQLFATAGDYTSNTTGNASFYGNTAYGSATTTGTYNPPQIFSVTKYGGTATIKAFKGNKPADNPNAYDAQELLHYLGPKMK